MSDAVDRFFTNAPKPSEKRPITHEPKEDKSFGKLKLEFNHANSYIKELEQDNTGKAETISELKQANDAKDRTISQIKLSQGSEISQLRSKIGLLDQELRTVRTENQSLISKEKEDSARLNEEIARLNHELADRPTIIKYQDKEVWRTQYQSVSSWLSFKDDVSEHARALIVLWAIVSSIVVCAYLGYQHYNAILGFLSHLFRLR